MNFIMIFAFLLGTISPEDTAQNLDFWEEQLRSESPDLRLNAVLRLDGIGSPKSVEALSKALDDPNETVRFAVIQTLAKIPTELGLQNLNAHLARERDPYLTSETKRSIQSITEFLKAAAEKEKAAQESKTTRRSKKK